MESCAIRLSAAESLCVSVEAQRTTAMSSPANNPPANPVTKLSFWGVRGSTPTVDPATWRFGGNTPCLELTAPDGTQLILDCGTGLRVLGSRWTAPAPSG